MLYWNSEVNRRFHRLCMFLYLLFKQSWHDDEKFYDWKTGNSTTGVSVHCFRQVVWKEAKKLGCGKGAIDKLPFYVARMDRAAVIVDGLIGYELKNVGKPKQVRPYLTVREN